MRYIFLSIVLLLLSTFVAFSQFSSEGGLGTPIKEDGQGGVKIHLFNTFSNDARLVYVSPTPNPTFTKYSIGGSEQTVPSADVSNPSGDNSTYEIRNLQDGYGYVTGSHVAWIINYPLYLPVINSITPADFVKDNCIGFMKLNIDKYEPNMQYQALGGSIHNINRKYNVEYDNIKWDANISEFKDYLAKTENVTVGFEYNIESNIPLKDTHFKISGDQFARQFGIEISRTSDQYKAVAVDAYITQKIVIDGMDTDSTWTESAPITVHFYGHANEPTGVDYFWTIYKNGNYDDYVIRFSRETDITYTFTEAGKYEVKLEVFNEGGICSKEAWATELNISESMLEIPNFFSPDGSPGINDIFKVKHKSLVKFKATIFNRWGNKLHEWSNPDEGWDGKYNGKFVSPGVYFYVIVATGAEGKKYKKGGDINILRGK